MSFDRGDVYTASVLPGEENDQDTNQEFIAAFRKFILEFRVGSEFIYRNQLRERLLVKEYSLTVDAADLIGYQENLNKHLMDAPTEMVPLFERAITDVAKRIVYLTESEIPPNFPTCQLILKSGAAKLTLRELDADHISKIIRISGIVISASVLHSKATSVQIMCRSCRHTQRINVNSSFGGVVLPSACAAIPADGEKSQCPRDPYVIVHDKSLFIDQQSLKLQELPEMVPVGEMPRHVLLSADRYLTNKVIPGTRCTITGIYSTFQSKMKGPSSVAIRNPYVKVIGIETDVDHNAAGNVIFTEEEEEEFLELSRRPDLYEAFAKSIAPSIYGNEDIKKAIACLLMGGSKKLLPDGMRLRGDVNVLMLGDPGTAKSQLLKFVDKVSPISIYTSGKGSSAAGLTASVQRDSSTREFYLEGGAMVLADGGVVCIDEFDKMREEDRVAIHEAMEQQTISIAKAGITTVLNSRTSVLAAANPVYGRYDDTKTPGENIDFAASVMSRFDMIFIVKDDHNEARDVSIANHVLNIHMGRTNNQEVAGEIPLDTMRRYISYCRAKCAPRLSPDAAEKLSSHFVEIRKQVHDKEVEADERSSIPITVRQLEAIIRIAESLAKLELSPVAKEEHVDEAIRLFQASTMDAASQGIINMSPETLEEVRKIEREIRKRLPIGFSTTYDTLKREFVVGKEYNQLSLDKALYAMERQETITMRFQRQNVLRSGP
ncbi:CYFA0S12e02916g1_1 [Cyberlindnera fabianii]|uniref:DNA replication licensing factor MCM5 n=1 Tax=Cyberlindnera fabianii TaxID=36022 RepID=A0A061B2H1_CYBFA|nr:Minichromosome maintenance protein 5 [Cyberlindnera fabianii]CDR43656.1 CYFA0S12e02916g1_1 [Cyberlindnera fabianii]